jgi:hypothetical protein
MWISWAARVERNRTIQGTAHLVNWKKMHISREMLLVIWFAFTIGIFDGLFGIDAVRGNIFPVEYQSFWGSLFSIYYFVGIVLIFGNKVLKDKLRFIQAILVSLVVYNLAEFIHRIDAVRMGFITLNQLIYANYEFNGLLGKPLILNLYHIILMYVILSGIAIFIEVYRRKVRHV